MKKLFKATFFVATILMLSASACSDSNGMGKSSLTSVQCSGYTKKGVRCKNMTTNKNGYCYKHQDQAPRSDQSLAVKAD